MHNILGTKIRRLREDMGITQEEMADAVGLSSEFISLLELGKRDPSLESLGAISRFFQKDLSFFLGEKDVSFLSSLEENPRFLNARKEIKRFKEFCERYVKVEEMTARPLHLAPLYTNVSAAYMAKEERNRLGLGDHPVGDIFSVIESNGLRVFRHPLPDDLKVAGLFLFEEQYQAAFVFINSAFSQEQQSLMAAHAYGHYLKDREEEPVIDTTDIYIEEYLSLYPVREIFAQTFATCFLMPPEKLKELIERDLRVSRLNFGDVLYLKRYFKVPLHTIIQALSEKGYISKTLGGNFKKRDAGRGEEALFSTAVSPSRKIKDVPQYSDRFITLCYDAYHSGKLTEKDLHAWTNIPSEKIRLLSP